MRRTRLVDRIWNPYGGFLVTLAGIAVTEVVGHFVPGGATVGITIFLITLGAVAYSALKGGFKWGAASALLLAVYTLHYVSPHASIIEPSGRVFQGAVIMLVIGLGIATPMTFLKRREDRFRGAIERRNLDLQLRNAELTEANAALEAFGYVVSHDLKEPVRAIENYLEAATEEYGTEAGRAYLETARDANRRLTHMLQGLLAYSRASSATPTLAPLDVGEVLRGDACRTQYETALRERGAALEVQPRIPRVLADEVILSQLLGNVVLNAVKHNRSPKPVIRIRAEDAPAGRVRIVAEDNGPGFPPDVLQRFEGLRAARTGTVKGGFGLVISHRAAQRLGGRMWIENGDGSGARVIVELEAAGEAHGPKVQVQAGA